MWLCNSPRTFTTRRAECLWRHGDVLGKRLGSLGDLNLLIDVKEHGDVASLIDDDSTVEI
jgi:hypothetical protein